MNNNENAKELKHSLINNALHLANTHKIDRVIIYRKGGDIVLNRNYFKPNIDISLINLEEGDYTVGVTTRGKIILFNLSKSVENRLVQSDK